MGSPCLFTRQQALKLGYFYWLRVKSSNHLHTKLNLGYLKGTKFCLESKASFIDLSSIASFKPFLIAWLREYCTFSGSSVVNLKSMSRPKYTQLRTTYTPRWCVYDGPRWPQYTYVLPRCVACLLWESYLFSDSRR